MARPKKQRRAPGGGRKPIADELKRVNLVARVAPGTRAEIQRAAKEAGISIGVLLDRHFGRKPEAEAPASEEHPAEEKGELRTLPTIPAKGRRVTHPVVYPPGEED